MLPPFCDLTVSHQGSLNGPVSVEEASKSAPVLVPSPSSDLGGSDAGCAWLRLTAQSMDLGSYFPGHSFWTDCLTVTQIFQAKKISLNLCLKRTDEDACPGTEAALSFRVAFPENPRTSSAQLVVAVHPREVTFIKFLALVPLSRRPGTVTHLFTIEAVHNRKVVDTHFLEIRYRIHLPSIACERLVSLKGVQGPVIRVAIKHSDPSGACISLCNKGDYPTAVQAHWLQRPDEAPDLDFKLSPKEFELAPKERLKLQITAVTDNVWWSRKKWAVRSVRAILALKVLNSQAIVSFPVVILFEGTLHPPMLEAESVAGEGNTPDRLDAESGDARKPQSGAQIK